MLSTQWTKSTRSGHTGACVEARLNAAGVEVRDSKDVTGPTLFTNRGEWLGLIAITKNTAKR